MGFEKQLNDVLDDTVLALQDIVVKIGVLKRGVKTLSLPDEECQFNIGNRGFYLNEVTESNFIDNGEFEYSFDALLPNDLVFLVDFLIEKYGVLFIKKG